MTENRKVTVVVLLVVILALGIIAAVAVPMHIKAVRNKNYTSCISNMRILWSMQINYVSQFGGEMELFPTETGTRFWIKLTETNPPLLDESLYQVFFCPMKGEVGSFGETNYRGPAYNVNLFGDGDPVGADFIDNHSSDGGEGGNVVRKSGDVVSVPSTDYLWRYTFEKLKGGPER